MIEQFVPSQKYFPWTLTVLAVLFLPIVALVPLQFLKSTFFSPSVSPSDFSALTDFLIHGILGVWGAFTISAFLFQKIVFRDSFRNIGFTKDVGQFALGFLLGIVAILLIAVVLWLGGKYQILECVCGTRFLPSSTSLIGSFGAGFFEELLFRGVYIKLVARLIQTQPIVKLPQVRVWLNKQGIETSDAIIIAAVLLTSLLFGTFHLRSEPDLPPVMILVTATSAGIAFSIAYLSSKTLWLPIGLHFSIDLFLGWLGIFGVSSANATILATQVNAPRIEIATLQILTFIPLSLAVILLQKRRAKQLAPVID